MIEYINNLLYDVEVCVRNSLPDLESERYKVNYKPDGSPVTQCDILLEKRIKDLLSSRLPNLNFIGEESFRGANADLSSGYVAIVDPIDGTENFCSGLKEWGVSLGIWKDGRHLGSLLYMPELDETLMTGNKAKKVSSRITGFSSSYAEEIALGISSAMEYRVTGCAVYNLMNVIRGSFYRFVNPKGAYIWDLLPGLMLALENGCEVLLDDEVYDGKLLDPSRKYRVDIRHRYDLHPG